MDMKKLIFPLLFLSLQLNAQTTTAKVISPKEHKVSLDLAQLNAKLILDIKSKPANKNVKDNSFSGVQDCDQSQTMDPMLESTGKCFEFKSATKATIRAPIVVVKAAADPKAFDELKNSYKKLQITLKQLNKAHANWGSMHHWSTEVKNPDHYIFVSPKDKELTLRVGPIPDEVMNLYNMKWTLKPW